MVRFIVIKIRSQCIKKEVKWVSNETEKRQKYQGDIPTRFLNLVNDLKKKFNLNEVFNHQFYQKTKRKCW